ncbi:MAG: transglutaminase domain-containing protein [Planctomycetales bacterium]
MLFAPRSALIRRFVLSFALLTAVLLPGKVWSADSASAEAPRESWNVIFISGTRVGYTRSTLQKTTADGKTIWKSNTDTHLVIRRFGQDLKMQHHLETTETDDGDMLTFRYEMHNPPAQSSAASGEVVDGKLKLTTSIFGVPLTRTFPFDKEVKSPAYQDRLLEQNPLKVGETRKFKVFIPEYNKPSTITMKAGKEVEVSLLEEKKEKLLQVQVTQTLIPGVVTQIFLNPKSEAMKTATAMLGTEMTSYLVSRDEALKEVAAGELDLGVETLVVVAPIPEAHHTSRVQYKVTVPETDLESALPKGNSQEVKNVGEGTAMVTVRSLRPTNTKDLPLEKPADEYRQPSRFLQSDNAKVQAHAKEAAGAETDSWKVARLLERYVYEKLTRKDFSTAMASAAEVAESLQGDCTEHACLLAAMARARGIPARVAVGLVYVPSKHAFGGHMWTEVNIDNHWIPVDATLGQGGIGAAHIKLADSSLADDSVSPGASFLPLVNLLGKMKIEVIKVEGPNATP